MRALSITLLATCAVALTACGDNEENVRSGGGGDAAGSIAAAAPPTAAEGCRKVAEPKPRKDGDLERPKTSVRPGRAYTAVMRTNCGDLTIRLAASRAPKTVSSFVALARADFFDDLLFHRIVPGFVAQGGDPTGTGNGGPGYQVVEAPPSDLKYTTGIVAMAKTELDKPGTSGSQFFIVTGPQGEELPADYALLGKVEGPEDVLKRLDAVPGDPADNRPTDPVVIEDVEIRDEPAKR